MTGLGKTSAGSAKTSTAGKASRIASAALFAFVWTVCTANGQDAPATTTPATSAGPQATAGMSGRASDEAVAEFRADPTSLLRANPVGGRLLSRSVKELVMADVTLVASLVDIASMATPLQSNAIGMGIGEALRIFGLTDSESSQAITRIVAESRNGDLFAGFNAGIGEVQTFASSSVGAISAAGGGSGGELSASLNGLLRPFASRVGAVSATSPSVIRLSTTTSLGGATIACMSSVSPSLRC